MRFRRALIVTVAAQMCSLALTVVFILLSARWLGPAGKGTQSLLISIGQIAAVVLGFGFQGALPSVVAADHSQAPAAVRVQLKLLVIAAVILAIACAVSGAFGWSAKVEGQRVNLTIFTLVTIAQLSLAGLALALNEVWVSSMSNVVASASSLAVAVALHGVGTITPGTIVIAQSLGLFAGGALVVACLRERIWHWHEERLTPDIWRYARASVLGWLSALFALLMVRGDLIILTILGGGVRATGIYSIAVFTAEVALKVPNWAAAVLTPSVAADSNIGRDRTIQLYWISSALTVLAFALVVLAQVPLVFVLQHVAGADFASAYPVIIALFPRIVLQSGTSILAGNLAGKGYTVFHPASNVAGMAGVWLCDWLLIPKYGIVGAGVASSLGYTLSVFVIVAGFLRYNHLSLRSFMTQSVALFRAQRLRLFPAK